MKSTNYLTGGLGQSFDSHHAEQELRSLRRSLAGERLVHRNQDANIEALWQETHELKIYLRALIHLLTNKRLLRSCFKTYPISASFLAQTRHAASS